MHLSEAASTISCSSASVNHAAGQWSEWSEGEEYIELGGLSSGDEVFGMEDEDREAAFVGDEDWRAGQRGFAAVGVALGARRGEGDASSDWGAARRSAEASIADEGVCVTVGIVGHEIGGIGREADKPPGLAHPGRETIRIARSARWVHRDQRQRRRATDGNNRATAGVGEEDWLCCGGVQRGEGR